jgi:hypothetical protein
MPIACRRAARGNAFASTFLSQGAVSFVGYTDYVDRSFSKPRGISTFNHLVANRTVGTYPANGDYEADADPAAFRAFNSDPNERMRMRCFLVSETNIFIEYTWPVNQRDLDTGTMFDSQRVGWNCGYSGPFMSWSGDDTSAGGSERVEVNLSAALAAGKLANGTVVNLQAGWYSPAQGSGLATVTVSLKSKVDNQLYRSQQLSIAPGTQNVCAFTLVGTVLVSLYGPPGNETVSFVAST